MHIHSVVEECEIVELLQQIDIKTKKPMKKKPLFVKNGAFVVCRVQVHFVAMSIWMLFLFDKLFCVATSETILPSHVFEN